MKKRYILVPLALIATGISIASLNGKSYQIKGIDESQNYNLFFSSNTNTFYNENYLSDYVLTNNGNPVFINSENANIKLNGNFATLLSGKSFISVGRSDYGFNNGTEFGITELEIKFDSTISDISTLKIVINGSESYAFDYDSANNKINIVFEKPVHYFAIEKDSTENVVIKNINVNYSCISSSPIEQLTKKYDTNFYNDYYAGITSWKNGEDLKNKLYDLLRDGFVSLGYDWSINKEADKSLYDFEMIDGVYSDQNFFNELTTTSWNREHAFPATLLTGYASSYATAYAGRATDYHNLYAAYSGGNSSRGNKNYGVADVTNSYYKEAGTDTLGIGTYSYDPLNFEPADNDKGKLARSLLYMGVMYKEDEPNQYIKVNGKSKTAVTLKGVNLVEDYVGYDVLTYNNFSANTELSAQYGASYEGYGEYIYDNAPFAIGNLSTLLDWSNNHSISRQEYQHNITVYGAQNNRNPFVDYPELADYVYGNKKYESGRLDQLKPSYLDLNINSDKAYYAIESAKRSYNRDETIKASDFNIVTVNNDFSTSVCDFNVEFADVKLNSSHVGQYDVNINTPINKLNYLVDVLDATACKYEYILTGKSGSGDLSGIKNSTSGGEVTFGDLNWKISWGNGAAIGSKNKTLGVAFGTSAINPTDLTFETIDVLQEVNLVYFNVSCASGATGDYKIYVGDELQEEGTYERDANAPTLLSVSLQNPINGKVKIVLNTTSGAIYMHSIGINYK